MSKIVKNLFVRFTETFQFPSELMSVSPGTTRYVPRIRSYPSTEECWRIDRKNLSEDFTRAYSRLESSAVSPESAR